MRLGPRRPHVPGHVRCAHALGDPFHDRVDRDGYQPVGSAAEEDENCDVEADDVADADERRFELGADEHRGFAGEVGGNVGSV
jgi:hypothetical protein